jgi:hypothetical protein
VTNKMIPIGFIRVGKRHRKDMGDLDAFACNIKEIGLLHPPVIRPDGLLIAGERRNSFGGHRALNSEKPSNGSRVPASKIYSGPRMGASAKVIRLNGG